MIHDSIDRLDAMLYSTKVSTSRSEKDCAALETAVMNMERYKARLNIPQRDIAIIRYLAKTPAAIIVREPNVMGAFKSAKAAMNYARSVEENPCFGGCGSRGGEHADE